MFLERSNGLPYEMTDSSACRVAVVGQHRPLPHPPVPIFQPRKFNSPRKEHRRHGHVVVHGWCGSIALRRCLASGTSDLQEPFTRQPALFQAFAPPFPSSSPAATRGVLVAEWVLYLGPMIVCEGSAVLHPAETRRMPIAAGLLNSVLACREKI